ncbi:MAG: hypothetical protein HY238_04900, partial [Acidobacteria bacterium]|nr:hypothetical protein [Acidobacteriota bacterium]
MRISTLGVVLSLTVVLGWGQVGPMPQMAVVNGASFDPAGPMAPGSFATIFGQDLCAQTAAGEWIEAGRLPTSLGGCMVMVGGTRAMLHFVSPAQVNFIVPDRAQAGMADVMVHNGPQTMMGSMQIGAAGPGVFTLNGMGTGEGAMLHGTTWRTGPFSATTNGQPTPVSIFLTGLNLSVKPVVLVGGLSVEVTFWGLATGYAGLQQINIVLPPGLAGVGRVPVTVVSDGQTSNATFLHMLPTTAMMQGMPGFGPGMTVPENTRRGREMSYMALNPANNTALVTDENDDAVRVIALDSKSTVATITLPMGSEADAIAVNAAGTLAAVALAAKSSVALIDLAQNKVLSVVGTGYYPSHLAFAGTNLLVTNAASDSVSVIDAGAGMVTRTIAVGHGPSGVATAGNIAVVANLQSGTVSLINLASFAVATVKLPPGSRPHEVAICTVTNKAVIATPMSNGVVLLNLANNQIATVDTGALNAMGPGAVVTNNGLAFIASQMTAEVTVVDTVAGKVVKTFSVDPGPRSLAVNPAKNQLVVLAEGTGTLDVVDLNSYGIKDRLNAGET